MYAKKTRGPASVCLSDGTIMTRSDLPVPDTKRWVASRKAAVVKAVKHGLMQAEEACEIYNLSEEELAGWSDAVARHGEIALKTTRLQQYRQL